MDRSSKSLGFIDAMYGVCTLLVIFGHSHPLHCDYPLLLRKITEFIYCFHMPCFFYIAGFLIRYTGDGRDVWGWWVKKCRRLLFPYIVLTLLAWLPKVMLSDLMNDTVGFSFDSVIRVLLIPRDGIWGHFWFVPVYLILELTGAVWLTLWKKYPKMSGGVIIIASVLNMVPVPVKWFGVKDITENLIYIILGILTCDLILGQRSDFLLPKGLISLFLSFVIYFCIPNSIVRKLICICMIYSVVCISKYLDMKQWKWLEYIGNHAFTIYIYSWPIQAVLEMVIVVIAGGGWGSAYLVMFAGGLLGPLLLWEVYMRKMKRNRFLDRMLGVR